MNLKINLLPKIVFRKFFKKRFPESKKIYGSFDILKIYGVQKGNERMQEAIGIRINSKKKKVDTNNMGLIAIGCHIYLLICKEMHAIFVCG